MKCYYLLQLKGRWQNILTLAVFQPSSTTHPSLHHSGKGSNDNIATSLKKVLAEVHHLRKDNDRIKQSFEKIKECVF